MRLEYATGYTSDEPSSAPQRGRWLTVSLSANLRDTPSPVQVRPFGHPSETMLDADDSLRIGAGERLSDVALHPVVIARYPMLASACAQVGTPAIRAMSTLGGNLAQRPQCEYFRHNVPCYKNGGNSCPALHGDNQHLAILEGGPCFVVHPSDPAVALVALDAVIEIDGLRGTRSIPASEFFVLPAETTERETVLARGERIVSISLPSASAGGLQHYTKRMQDGEWTFALVSLAAARRVDGDVRLVLGGVSPRPYRVYNSVEEEAMSGGLDDDAIMGLAERALLDAEPLSKNGYKVELAAVLLRDAIREIAAD